jgi:serine/threonine protein kinase
LIRRVIEQLLRAPSLRDGRDAVTSWNIMSNSNQSVVVQWNSLHPQQSASAKNIFQKLQLIGRGAYGGVYKVSHIPTSTLLALKVINLDTKDDDINEIRQEVALLSRLGKKAGENNITGYHGCWLEGAELWIAMDLAEGGSVRTLVRFRME